MTGSQEGDWRDFTVSGPIRVDGGMVTASQRGPIATTWWSQRFTAILESYGLGGRMQRGRRYARTGQVVSLDVGSGLIVAAVQGSRPDAYVVTVNVAEPTVKQWELIDEVIRAKVGFVARLLGGEVPPDLEEVFAGVGASLFPVRWSQLVAACSCPDGQNPCKHIAAALYVFADRLDSDPWLVLRLCGRSREDLFAAVAPFSFERTAITRSDVAADVAPWWPFGPGPLPELADSTSALAALRPDDPAAVLDRLAPLAAAAGAEPAELVRRMYERILAEVPEADRS